MNTNYLKWLYKYIVCWLFWMAVSRLMFGVYNVINHQHISLYDFLKSFLFGSYMDLSIVGYILIFILFALITYQINLKNIITKIIKFYTYLLIILFSFICSVDTVIYKEWGYKLDATPLFYLNKAGEASAFISFRNLMVTMSLFIFLIGLGIYLFKRIIFRNIHLITSSKLNALITLLIIPILIIPIRGGIGLAPMNLSKVYFSKNIFADHLAVNTVWNVIYSITEKDDLKSKFDFMPETKAENLMASLFPSANGLRDTFLNSTHPNVLFIILESFTAKAIDFKLNGIEVTPNLNMWCRNELYFSNMFASADRTDEGLVALYSGFPSQPKSSIMNYPNKCSQLPSLITPFKSKNYNTKFFYGGDISFANMESYLLLLGIDTIIDKTGFSKESYNAKWGVHDHILFNRVLNQVEKAKDPFFYSMISLSSHPPYDVPVPAKFKGLDEESMFLNAMNYTDNSLGLLVDNLRKSPKWKNLLIIITADHGARYPLNSEYYEPSRFKIPMLWMGGAVKKSINYNKICSQTDFCKTLLNQTGNSSSNFIFSHDLFVKERIPYAWYAFNNGFTFISENGYITYNNDGNTIISKTDSSSLSLEKSKAILQVVTNKFYNY